MELSELKSNYFNNCSLLVLQPKQAFLTWLSELQNNIDEYDYYYDERENGVWLIKYSGLFTDEEKFQEYLFMLKPRLLRSEVFRFTQDYLCEFTAENFDIYFDIDVRDVISNINDIL